MTSIRKPIIASLIVLASTTIALASPQAAAADQAAQATSLALVHARGCAAGDNLDERADSFISRCRNGSIRREFPARLINSTLGEIRGGVSAEYKWAWHLLNDKYFVE